MIASQKLREGRTALGIIFDISLIVGALALSTVLIKREFGGRQSAVDSSTKPRFVARVKNERGNGRWIGDSSAPVRLTVFNDLECPFCAKFHATLHQALAQYPHELAVRFVHFPLPNHRFAKPAAIAAECAANQGKFEQFVTSMYANQDSIGLKRWSDFAATAGVEDADSFNSCITKESDSFSLIGDGLKFGQDLGIKSTPSIFINGWLYSIPPDQQTLEKLIKEFVAGKTPENE